MNKKRIIQFSSVILIVIALGLMYYIKNKNDNFGEASANFETPLVITEINMEEIESSEIPVMLDFGAEECGPCQQMKPALESVNKKMQGKAVVQYIDAWEYPEQTADFPIQVVPTQVFYLPGGKPYVPSEDIQIYFKMYALSDTGEHVLTVHEGILTEEEMLMILEDMGVEQ